jgi:methylamine dehydrogenase heavy chain
MTLPHAKARSIAARPLIAALFLCSCGLPALAQTTAAPPAPPAKPASVEPEQAYTETMLPPQAGWGFVRTQSGGTAIFDSATGKMKGTLSTSPSSDMAFDPAGKFYYVSETIWTKIGRGTRQDMVAIYDSTAMKLQAEIAMPGRLLIGGRKQNFIVSDDGKTGYVYNMDPASSVNMLDLVKRKFVRAIELPGCASLVPVTGVGFSALCSDGSLATVATAGAKPAITRSASFFDPKGDPIFDNFAYDKVKGEATYISYTGLIYQVKLGATPTISTPWSIQAAAGIRPGDTKALEASWLPGGSVPLSLNYKSGHLFVLMHMGEYWSQKQAGNEVWEVDLATRKVVKRMVLEAPADNVEVTQGDAPMLFFNQRKGGNLWVFDAKTYEQKYKVENGGGGVIFAYDPR